MLLVPSSKINYSKRTGLIFWPEMSITSCQYMLCNSSEERRLQVTLYFKFSTYTFLDMWRKTRFDFERLRIQNNYWLNCDFTYCPQQNFPLSYYCNSCQPCLILSNISDTEIWSIHGTLVLWKGQLQSLMKYFFQTDVNELHSWNLVSW